ncbi:zinc knuckle protein [Paraphaeosphaeria sporulosa]
MAKLPSRNIPATTTDPHREKKETFHRACALLAARRTGRFRQCIPCAPTTNLRKRKRDEKTVRWIASFLGDRHTRIRIDGFTSTQYATSTDVPQGSPLSPILYLFYNADLIDMCKQEANVLPTGYIDDIAILARAETTKETCDILGKNKTLQIAQQWASTHASVFSPDKFQLTHFARTRKKIDTNHSIQTIWGETNQSRPANAWG